MRLRARHLRAALGSALLLSLPVLSLPSDAAVPVQGIRHWTNPEYTRVVVDLGAQASFEADFLRGDPERGLPPRIFVDIHGADAPEELLRTPVRVENGLLRQVRAGRHRSGVVRVVIDLERESGYTVFAMDDPARIVIDVNGRAGGEPSVPQGVGAQRIVVMIDPGHGGKDPGAIGPTGLQEKDVVLSIGRRLRERLAADPSFDVRMTRDADVFLPLEERTAMANQAGAVLFVSLHINASRDRRAEGISTYVLSRTSTDRESLELAARENGVPVEKLEGVRFILDELSLYGRKKERGGLAKTVNDSIVRKVSLRHGRVTDLGLKQAPFYVLVGARMTAILVETSFISNRREEGRLRDERYLDTIAESVADAVRYYAEKNGTLSTTAGL